MTDAIMRRGPDDEGFWLDDEAGVAMGHRRLSILDLSAAGHQPMASRSGRFMLIFNGEIYNHQELRENLASNGAWRGGSDTETLLEAFDRWGLEQTLEKCRGMFALALWDRKLRELTLARDRFGEKPLYYGWWTGRFVFGSDLASFKALPGEPPDIDWTAARAYFLHNAVPAPLSIYKGIYKLSPGCLIKVHAGSDAREIGPKQQTTWWSAADVAGRAPFAGDAGEATAELQRLLTRAVSLQMLADVPVGAFLSGGVDSSLVCAIMQQRSTSPVRTFSIGFEQADYNEAPHAKAVAAHLGTKHTELTVTSSMAAELAPMLGSIWTEPFADSSQLPTAILSILTANEVTVALSGDGGDELFNGYTRYQAASAFERVPARPLLAWGTSFLPPEAVAALIRLVPHPLAKRARPENVARLREILSGPNPIARYAQQLYQPTWHATLLRGGLQGSWTYADPGVPNGDVLNAYGLVDVLDYLPNDILTKVDRASMAASLETRIPLLDSDVAEFALRLPSTIKKAKGTLKSPLRDLLYQHVPRQLVDRPKMGFGVPLGDWLRGSLRSWAEPLMGQEDELFEPEPIGELWREHLTGTRDWSSILWRVLMFRAWRGSQHAAMPFGNGLEVRKRPLLVAV